MVLYILKHTLSDVLSIVTIYFYISLTKLFIFEMNVWESGCQVCFYSAKYHFNGSLYFSNDQTYEDEKLFGSFVNSVDVHWGSTNFSIWGGRLFYMRSKCQNSPIPTLFKCFWSFSWRPTSLILQNVNKQIFSWFL